MSCSKISEYLVALVPLNYKSPANLESAGDDNFFIGKRSKSCIFKGYFDVVVTFSTLNFPERSEGQFRVLFCFFILLYHFLT